MIEETKWYGKLPNKVKDLLNTLIEKAENKTCVEVEEVRKISSNVSWTNLPSVVKDTLALLGVTVVDKGNPNWQVLPVRVALLESKIKSLDCRKLNPILERQEEEEVETEQVTEEVTEELDENISKIHLVEFDKDEDLTGDNEKVDITVYFEDKSGDEVPNIGIKLFTDKEQTKPLEGYKGAFYFTNSKTEDKVTMLVRSTGTVKRTKFKV